MREASRRYVRPPSPEARPDRSRMRHEGRTIPQFTQTPKDVRVIPHPPVTGAPVPELHRQPAQVMGAGFHLMLRAVLLPTDDRSTWQHRRAGGDHEVTHPMSPGLTSLFFFFDGAGDGGGGTLGGEARGRSAASPAGADSIAGADSCGRHLLG